MDLRSLFRMATRVRRVTITAVTAKLALIGPFYGPNPIPLVRAIAPLNTRRDELGHRHVPDGHQHTSARAADNSIGWIDEE